MGHLLFKIRRSTAAAAVATSATAALIIISLGLLFSGCSPVEEEHEETTTTKVLPTDTAPPPKSVGTEISIEGMKKAPFFKPAEVKILTGGRVTWTNNDKDKKIHTVTADDKEYDSDKLTVGDVFSRSFDASGDYEYHCSIHPKMKGTVIVRDKEEDLEP